MTTGGKIHKTLPATQRGGVLVVGKANEHELDPKIHELARGRNFAALTTMLPDGHPQTQVMWIDADEDRLLINTEIHRQKFKNVERDPRVTVMVWDQQDPYHFGEVRGEVVEKVKGDEAREHIDSLSQKYRGKPYGPRSRASG